MDELALESVPREEKLLSIKNLCIKAINGLSSHIEAIPPVQIKQPFKLIKSIQADNKADVYGKLEEI